MKKSQLMMPLAWLRRNAHQVSDERRGAGSMPAPCRIAQIVLAASSDSEPGELAVDSPVAPGWVLPRQLQDQRADLPVVAGSPGRRCGYGPAARNESSVPTTNRLGSHKDAAPPVARQQPGERREQDPISRAAVRPSNLPAKQDQLVPQDKDLDLVRSLRPATQHGQSEQLSQQPVQDKK